MRGLLVGCALLVTSVSADAKGKGALVDIDFKQVRIGDVMRIVADTGRINVVFLEGADTKVDVLEKRVPWDDALATIVANAKLAFVREGNLYIIGPQAAIDARKAAKKSKAAGPLVDLDLVGATAKDAAHLLAIASGTAYELDGGNELTLRLRRANLSVVKDVLALASGAKVVPAPAKRAVARAKGACAAPTLPATDLELVAIAGIGVKRWALLGTKTSVETFVISPTDCVGVEGRKVKAIGQDFFELASYETADKRVEAGLVLVLYKNEPSGR